MTVIWILLGALVLGVLVVIVRTSRSPPEFTDAELLAFCGALARVREEALAHGPLAEDAAPPSPGDPGTATTPAGLRIVYVLSHAAGDRGDRLYHLVSISTGEEPISRSAAAFLTGCVHSLYGLRGSRLHAAISRRGRFHLVFEMTPEEHEAYVARTVELPREAEIPELRELWMRSSVQVKFGRVPAG